MRDSLGFILNNIGVPETPDSFMVFKFQKSSCVFWHTCIMLIGCGLLENKILGIL